MSEQKSTPTEDSKPAAEKAAEPPSQPKETKEASCPPD